MTHTLHKFHTVFLQSVGLLFHLVVSVSPFVPPRVPPVFLLNPSVPPKIFNVSIDCLDYSTTVYLVMSQVNFIAFWTSSS